MNSNKYNIMKYLISICVLILSNSSLYAHEGGHNNYEAWIINDTSLKSGIAEI